MAELKSGDRVKTGEFNFFSFRLVEISEVSMTVKWFLQELLQNSHIDLYASILICYNADIY